MNKWVRQHLKMSGTSHLISIVIFQVEYAEANSRVRWRGDTGMNRVG